MDPRFIRNFCIIAHIDHGKSTLADRLLELTGALSQREMTEQVLDSMDLERERGITIKAKSIRLHYEAKDGNDVPAQFDRYARPRGFFLRSLARAFRLRRRAPRRGREPGRRSANRRQYISRGAAQSHHHPRHQQNRSARRAIRNPREEQIENVLAIPAADALLISAKSGLGVEEVLEAIVARIPAPTGSSDAPLQALIFDSWFDAYRGAVVLVRVMEGRITRGQRVKFALLQ